VKLGKILFSYDFLDTRGSDLKKMNKKKKDKPFEFPDSFILIIGYIRQSFYLPYRQTEGTIEATGKRSLANPSYYGHFCNRTNKLDIDIKKDKLDEDDDVVIAVDSTRISY
jgi:hypothetical protein